MCTSTPDNAHVLGRGAGGGTEPENTVALCREHHQEQHRVGWPRFALRHPVVLWDLESKGWEVRDVLGRTKLVRRTGADGK